MTGFLLKRLNLILSLFIGVFLVGYILFSSWSTSLDFGMDKVAKKQNEVHEQYELALSALTQTQSKEALAASSAGLGLVEITLADGYIDLRPTALSAAETLVNRQ